MGSELESALLRRKALSEPGQDQEEAVLEPERKENGNGKGWAESKAVSEEASDELKRRLERRAGINEGRLEPSGALVVGHPSVYAEFEDLGRGTIKRLEKSFRSWDEDGDGRLNLAELKRLMEGIGAPQTHLGLKAMLCEVDEDGDSALSFREFLLIARMAGGEGGEGGGEGRQALAALAARMEVDVGREGVGGAAAFFEAKAAALKAEGTWAAEIRREQEAAKAAAEKRAAQRQAFLHTRSNFDQ